MKNFIRSAAMAIAILSSAATPAATFDFSYTFLDGTAIAGSFDGTANGNLVTGLSNIAVMANGASLAGSGALLGFSWSNDAGWVGGPTVSFDGYANNFIFANGNVSGFTNYFAMIPLNSSTGITNDAEYYRVAPGALSQDISSDGSIQSRWHLQASAVPEPETYGMMLAGIGVIGFLSRRRRQA